MTNNDLNCTWLTSKKTQKLLNISGCELMHLRENGKLTFRKQGNAFFYQIDQSQIEQNLIDMNQGK
ncbi:MAG: hypothetical protein ACI89T_002086 [Cognaticolwellia sp.]|jgi:hypothetical protein|uniref:hypothetical protein n=1 Tax=Colwellia sp. BRX8-4 TaxID=2759836 RepID=UPI0015F6A1F5|nr:hypothetical protein [Colwellia sp. BRX8-4]MBA6371512.1 hypothetical protein [Colwellia sp. BRX8-4]